MKSYEVTNLSVVKDGKVILSNIDLALEEATISGLYGKQGAGKTLLLKALSERCNTSRSEKTAPLFTASLVETNRLLPNKKALHNMKIVTRNHESLSEEDIVWYLEKVGLRVQDERIIAAFSKSEKLALAIALVLVENPNIILFDEPFNELENTDLMRFSELLKSLQTMRLATVIASGNLSLMEPICEKVYELEDWNVNA